MAGQFAWPIASLQAQKPDSPFPIFLLQRADRWTPQEGHSKQTEDLFCHGEQNCTL